jgi:hypothetical protein
MYTVLANVVEIVMNTPVWVWALYALLLVLGFSGLATAASRCGVC